jgi:hypothetical protein
VNRGRTASLGVVATAALVVLALPTIRAEWRRHSLLHWTDHTARGTACREVITAFAATPREPDYPWIRVCVRPHCQSDVRLPEVVRGLDPTEVSVAPDRLRVELGGGFRHYGIEAVSSSARQGGKGTVLSDGVWFYDAG